MSRTASAVVHCGTAISNGEFGATVRTVSAAVYDRHPVSNVTCTLNLVDKFGKAIWSGTKPSFGSGAAAQELIFVPVAAGVNTVHLQCSIPAATGGEVSHVTSYLASSSF